MAGSERRKMQVYEMQRPTKLRGRTPLTGEKGRRTGRSKRPLAYCRLCKQTQSPGTRRNHFARIWRVLQEANKSRAILSSMTASGNAIAVKCAKGLSAPVEEPCLRGCANQ